VVPKKQTLDGRKQPTALPNPLTMYFNSEWFLPTLQQFAILNKVFIVKFPVIVCVATILVNKDEYKRNLSNRIAKARAALVPDRQRHFDVTVL